jgi:hypothetical protein
VSGHFSPVEIAMTLAIGARKCQRLVLCLRQANWSLQGVGLAALFAGLQLVAFRVSLLPSIARQ